MMGHHTDPSLLSTLLLWGRRGLECEEGWGLGRQFRWRAIPEVSSRPPGASTQEPVSPRQNVAMRGVCLQRVLAQLPLTCPLSLQGPHSPAHPHGRGTAPGPAASLLGHPAGCCPWVSAVLAWPGEALPGHCPAPSRYTLATACADRDPQYTRTPRWPQRPHVSGSRLHPYT